MKVSDFIDVFPTEKLFLNRDTGQSFRISVTKARDISPFVNKNLRIDFNTRSLVGGVNATMYGKQVVTDLDLIKKMNDHMIARHHDWLTRLGHPGCSLHFEYKSALDEMSFAEYMQKEYHGLSIRHIQHMDESRWW